MNFVLTIRRTNSSCFCNNIKNVSLKWLKIYHFDILLVYIEVKKRCIKLKLYKKNKVKKAIIYFKIDPTTICVININGCAHGY